MFFFSFFFTHEAPRLSQNRSARNLPRQSLLPSLSPAQCICSSFSGTFSTTPGSKKVSWPPSEHEEEVPRRAPAVEEDSKRRQQKTHSSDRQAQGAPVRQMQDVVCSFFFFFFFLPLKTTSIINGLRTRFPRRPPGVNEWRIDGEFFVCQTEKMLQISVTQRCASLLPTGRGSYRHGPDRGLRLQELG